MHAPCAGCAPEATVPTMSSMSFEFDALRGRIAESCRRYRVRRLDVFGSSVRADFDHRRSDVDFLVEFSDASPEGAADRYFGLRDSLQAVVGHPVDLVMRGAVRNPYFLQAIAREQRNVYAA